MKLEEIINKSGFTVVYQSDTTKQVSGVFCCDLLSIAMSKAPACSAWVTVMGNVNAVAVSVLTDGACIILAEGIEFDSAAVDRATAQGVTILKSDKSIFDTGLIVHGILNA